MSLACIIHAGETLVFTSPSLRWRKLRACMYQRVVREIEKIRNEAVAAYYKVQSQNFDGGTGEKENPHVTADVPAET